MSIKNLEERKDLLIYINKKKDDEIKMMNLAGLTIGAIILLFVNITINSLNEISSILMIKNWLFKFMMIFTWVYNIIAATFLLYGLVFSGNNKQLRKNNDELDILVTKFKNNMVNLESINKGIKEIKDFFKNLSLIGNEIDRKALAFGRKFNRISFFTAIIINIYSTNNIYNLSWYFLPINILIIGALIAASIPKGRIVYKIGIISYFALSLLLLVLILCKYPISNLLQNFILFKYSFILCLLYLGIGVISIFLSKFYVYKWLVNLEDRIYEEQISDDIIKLELDEVYLKRANVGFFKR